jgi:hypothetical protein
MAALEEDGRPQITVATSAVLIASRNAWMHNGSYLTGFKINVAQTNGRRVRNWKVDND